MRGLFTLSVVSHHHRGQVQTLLAQLAKAPAGLFDKIIVTLNVPEAPPDWVDPRLHVVRNDKPRGFGANHNHAFSLCESLYFCVVNPDIELVACPEAGKPVNGRSAAEIAAVDVGQTVKTIFDTLAQTLSAPGAPEPGVAYPAQCRANGSRLDYARTLVTPAALLARRLKWFAATKNSSAAPDWASGAFLVFKSPVFAALGGFDERYFMYCEDVDICLRLQLAGYSLAEAHTTVTHHAQHRTLKSGQHLAWHVRSLLRLWRSSAYHQYLMMIKNRTN